MSPSCAATRVAASVVMMIRWQVHWHTQARLAPGPPIHVQLDDEMWTGGSTPGVSAAAAAGSSALRMHVPVELIPGYIPKHIPCDASSVMSLRFRWRHGGDEMERVAEEGLGRAGGAGGTGDLNTA